jgi:hypothetical protein
MVLPCQMRWPAGFTSMSKDVEPVEVMRFLNELYVAYDQGGYTASTLLHHGELCVHPVLGSKMNIKCARCRAYRSR